MKYIIDFYEYKRGRDILREENFVYEGDFNVAFSKGSNVMLLDGYVYKVEGHVAKLNVVDNFAQNIKINVILIKP